MHYGRALRARLARDDILVTPDVHDPLSAKVVASTGLYEAVKLTGSGSAVSRAGVPDAGLITMTEMVDHAKHTQEAVDIPVIADADNGYGNATNVVRTVREYIKSGVAGIHIEDQTFPKRNGDVKGVEVIPLEEAVGKVEAAVDVRDERDPDFVVIARTDVRRTANGTIDDAIERANAFADVGADVVFVKVPATREEARRVGSEVDARLLFPCSGTAPRLEPRELEAMGWDVVLYGRLVMTATVLAIRETVARFHDEGVGVLLENEERFAEEFDSVHELAGMPEIAALERRYLPEDALDKYEGATGHDIG
ncbi:carboxyvinyl-carboxyphosphonate phosphorylmutase [Salinigranum rubrum]|uniref:Carboxyvinyl-carboxyphosphonate phosphorylmutase n=1 Tax=Salinigranum rubrum TaxID=755307 RepID=A0A2I8VFX1_9EURY|nr:isocitrate lyase/PEP mutase family protein [Salinigranum rubrum]AUV80815.1 carboxyvinyl-carboxyphosphonate phosphorylmutase [Salinigranum rubrum]